MAVDLLQKVRKRLNIKNYSLAKRLTELGAPITTQGLDHYDTDSARSMRVDVLVRLREISGMSIDEFWKLLEQEAKRLPK